MGFDQNHRMGLDSNHRMGFDRNPRVIFRDPRVILRDLTEHISMTQEKLDVVDKFNSKYNNNGILFEDDKPVVPGIAVRSAAVETLIEFCVNCFGKFIFTCSVLCRQFNLKI
uniref:Uncharacterized protein n=1 Tax=Strigamia maritima TaxID=126957 RepID=T1IJH1_STRMM